MSRWIIVFFALAALVCHINAESEPEAPPKEKVDRDALFKSFVRHLAKSQKAYDKWLMAIYNNYAKKINDQKNDMNRFCMNTLATDNDTRYNTTRSMFTERNQKYWAFARKTALQVENKMPELKKLDLLLLTLIFNQHVDYQIGVKDFVFEDRYDYRNCMRKQRLEKWL